MNKEIWKTIEDYPYYEISNYGRVRSSDKQVRCGNGYTWKRGKIIVPNKDRGGYLRARLRNNPSDKKMISIHRLVAKYFIKNVYNKQEINHIDGNKSNNNYKNLEWVTRSENLIHALKNGLRECKRGRNCNLSKLNDDKVIKIRSLYASGNYTQKQIAALYGVTHPCIGSIVNNKSWNHI